MHAAGWRIVSWLPVCRKQEERWLSLRRYGTLLAASTSSSDKRKGSPRPSVADTCASPPPPPLLLRDRVELKARTVRMGNEGRSATI
jgi:hypothetical protein